MSINKKAFVSKAKIVATRTVRLLLLIALILLLRRIPARVFLALLQSSGVLLIGGGLLYIWYRLSKRRGSKRKA